MRVALRTSPTEITSRASSFALFWPARRIGKRSGPLQPRTPICRWMGPVLRDGEQPGQLCDGYVGGRLWNRAACEWRGYRDHFLCGLRIRDGRSHGHESVAWHDRLRCAAGTDRLHFDGALQAGLGDFLGGPADRRGRQDRECRFGHHHLRRPSWIAVQWLQGYRDAGWFERGAAVDCHLMDQYFDYGEPAGEYDGPGHYPSECRVRDRRPRRDGDFTGNAGGDSGEPAICLRGWSGAAGPVDSVDQ